MARKPRNTHHRKGNEEVVIVLGSGISGNSFDHLAKTIQEELLDVGVQVSDEVQDIFDQVGNWAVDELRRTSPVNPKGRNSGRYAKGWVYEKGKSAYNNQNKIKGVVRNKKDPQLTHLLEYGHPIVRNGKKVGDVPPKPHIREVAEACADAIDQMLDEL